MQIREAILKAADHIEANPGEFAFSCSIVPKSAGCGSPGCALGWIGFFMGICGDAQDVALAMGVPASDDYRYAINKTAEGGFYRRMRIIQTGGESAGPATWTSRHRACAQTLRAYADKYHPEEYPEVKAELNRIFAVERHGTGFQQAQVTGPKPCPAASVHSLAGQGVIGEAA